MRAGWAGVGRAALAMVLLLFCASSAAAGEAEPGRAGAGDTQALIELLRGKGVVNDDEARALLARKPEASGHDSWLDRIRIGGDVRLRYQGECFDCGNALLVKPEDPYELMNTRVPQHKGRVRARLLLKAAVNEHFEAGFRLSTGNETDPVSTNQALGDYLNNYQAVFDQLYLAWRPWSWLTAWGGRFPNPWFCSSLVWDPDLNFDGLAVSLERPVLEYGRVFLNAGIFPLQNVELSRRDKWLFGGQAGLGWTLPRRLRARVGVAYYGFENVVGIANEVDRPNYYDWTAPLFQQKGNTLMDIDPTSGIKTALAADYQELDVLGTLSVEVFDPISVTLLADFVLNLGFDRQAVIGRTGNPGLKDETMGFQGGLTVGHSQVRRFGAWDLFLFYRFLEADAVIDAFTDSDFHLGGTNAKGWILGGTLGLFDNVSVRGRWLSADEIEGPKLAIDVIQIDVNASF